MIHSDNISEDGTFAQYSPCQIFDCPRHTVEHVLFGLWNKLCNLFPTSKYVICKYFSIIFIDKIWFVTIF